MGNVKIPQMVWLHKATTVLTLYAFIWIALEGAIWSVMALSLGVTVVGAGWLVQRWLSGRVVAGWLFLVGTAVLGGVLGLLLNWVGLFFMALKTGLHAHGPEFNVLEIGWLMAQRPLWATVGFLVGIGTALIVVAFPQNVQLEER